jgi:hypothetical protein
MSTIVAIHGIGNQFRGEGSTHAHWLSALQDGLRRVGLDGCEPKVLRCVFYTDLFRTPDVKATTRRYQAHDITEPWEEVLLQLWWQTAADTDPNVPSPPDQTKGHTPVLVRRAPAALSQSRFFAGFTTNRLIFDLKQIYRYLHDAALRCQVQERIAQTVTPATRILIGHSLGSVIAYETLCAHSNWPIKTLVTLGSPLGIPHLILDQLNPPPRAGAGVWPGPVQHWYNIADDGDIVALVKELRHKFGPRVIDKRINNSATAHDVRPYLTAQETGQAIASGLG